MRGGIMICAHRQCRPCFIMMRPDAPRSSTQARYAATDVGIALLLLCDRVGVDLVEAMREKIALNAKNYPVSESKGRHSRPEA